MNLPNKLTVLRVILVPIFVAVLLASFPHHYLAAAALFGAASFTDHLDGRLARKNGQVTDFGKFLDPLADKILIVSALVCFVKLELAEVWMVLLIIAREFAVTSIRLVAADSGRIVAANSWGKAKTVSQIAAICIVLVLQYAVELEAGFDLKAIAVMAGDAAIFIAMTFSLVSGAVYVKENWDVIKQAA